MGRYRHGERVAGRFEIEGRLTSGGMAEIYVARLLGARGVSRRVALKRIHGHLADDPAFVAMFLDEARVSSQLSDPGVVPVLDAVEHDGDLLLVLDYVPGWDLSAVVREGESPLPLEVVVRIGRDVARALAYVHSATGLDSAPLSIVHRDVTPSNLLVGADGRVRLLDFGVAKAASSVAKTATATFKGKAAYASPEQVLGRPISARTDLYGLGLVLFELVSGRRLLDATDSLRNLELAKDPPRIPLDELRADVPTALSELVSELLAPAPEARPASAGEVERRLAEIAETLPACDATRLADLVAERMGGRAARPIDTGTHAVHRALAQLAGGGAATAKQPVQKKAAPPDDAIGADGARTSSERLPSTGPGPPTPGSPPLPRATGRRALVAGGVAVAALALAAGVVAVTTPAPPDPETPSGDAPAEARGFVRLVTEPAGAAVSIDGVAIEGTTPTVTPVRAGVEHRVTAVLDDHDDALATVEVAEDAMETLTLVLPRRRGRLTVRSEPSGALVIAGGEEVGVTPLDLDDLPRRAVDVEIRADGHAPHEETVPLDRVAEHVIDVTLAPRRSFGALSVSTVPWSQVSVDGRVIGTAPIVGHRLPVGAHTVTLRNPHLGVNETVRVRIEEDQTATVRRRWPSP